MLERRAFVRLLLLFMMLLSLACGPCSILSAEVPTPSHPIAVSPESAERLESRIRQNLGAEPGQQFIMQMTDAEVTSLVATKLAEVDGAVVANPQIWFTKGKIYGTGTLVNVLPIVPNFYVVGTARIADGRVILAIEESSAGALPIPQRVLETISRSINETVDDLQMDVTISALEILEGEAIVKGIRN